MYNLRFTKIGKPPEDRMGAGATIPASEDDALKQGYSQEEIDEYVRLHPEVLRRSDQLDSPKMRALSVSGDVGELLDLQEQARREAQHT